MHALLPSFMPPSLAQLARQAAVALFQQRSIATWGPTSPQPPLLLVHPRHLPDHQLQEASRLAATLTGTSCDTVVVGPGGTRRPRPSPATFFGRGAVAELTNLCTDRNPARVFINASLSGVQQRCLEMALGRSVLDRVGLIIEIFKQRAATKEARLQCQLAELEFQASRLVRVRDPSTGRRRGFGLRGETEVVSARERGRSGTGGGGLGGAGGGGESELQLQMRRLASKRAALRRQLEAVRQTRAVQRAGRRRSGKPLLALVGYTNAGKSSLLAALAADGRGRGIIAEDKLFSTLDPTSRRILLPSGRQAVASDTVGFISALPHQLIDAFRATLEEVTTADALIHVIDGASPRAGEQRHAVLGVLRELGMSEQEIEQRVIEAWNKADLIPEGGEGEERGGEDRLLVSAATGKGLKSLLDAVEARVEGLLGKNPAL